MIEDRPSPGIRRFPVDDGLLLLDTASHKVWAYSDSARRAWDVIETGDGRAEDIVAVFTEHYGIPFEIAQRDVGAILDEWRSLGLISQSSRLNGPADISPSHAATDWVRAAAPSWAAKWSGTIQGCVFEFAIEHPFDPHYVRALFQHMDSPGARPQCRLELRHVGDNEFALIEDGHERLRMRETGALLGALYQAVIERIHSGIAWLALMHGGSVARGGKGLLLPAPSGNGKSTLIAYLVSQGFQYVADDLLAVATDGKVLPWPMPLSLKPGSWEPLAPYCPYLPDLPLGRAKGKDVRLFVPAAESCAAGPVRPAAVVFPRFASGATAALEQIGLFDAIARLLSDRIWLGYPITEERMKAFLAWFEGIPSYVLTYGRLQDAYPWIEKAMA
jgi:hypothetical protein